MSLHLNAQKGFTLLEVVLYSALFSLLITSLLSLSWTLRQSLTKADSHLDTVDQANLVQTKLTRLLDQSAVISPSLGHDTDHLSFRQSSGDLFTAYLQDQRLVLAPEAQSPAFLSSEFNQATKFNAYQSVSGQLVIVFTLDGQTFTWYKQLL